MRILSNLGFVVLIWVALASGAFAQNTSGVLGPDVKAGHKSAEYRIAYDVDTGRFAQRLHYQQAIDEDLRWRVVVRTRETATSDFDFDYLQAELLWQISEDNKPFRTGLRFDARLRDNDRPAQLGVNWTNQWTLGDGWATRLVAISALQIGENRKSGISLGPRAQIAKKLESGPKVGIDYFGSFGNTKNFAFRDNRQGVGPFISTKFVGKTTVTAGLLFGLTDAAPDTDLRLFVNQGF